MMSLSWIRSILLATVACLVLAGPASAQFAVVTVKSLDELRADVDYLAEAVGEKEAGKKVAELLAMLGGTGSGVDGSKPFGLYVLWPNNARDLENLSFPVYGFLPITGEAPFLDLLRKLGGKTGKADKGVIPITAPDGTELGLRFAHGQAHLALNPAWLHRDLPAPAQVLPKGDQRSLLLARFLPERLPKEYVKAVEKALKPLRQILDEQVEPLLGKDEKGAGESQAQFKQRMAIKQQIKEAPEAIKQLVIGFVEQTRVLSLELGIDRKKHDLALELALVPKEKSGIAEVAAYMARARSRFDYLTRGARFNLLVNFPGPEHSTEEFATPLEMRQMMREMLPDPRMRVVMEGMMQVLVPTILKDGLDFCLTERTVGGKQIKLLGLKVRNGRKLDHLMRDAVKELSAEEREALPIAWNHARHGTARIHRLGGRGEEAFIAVRDDVVFAWSGEEGVKVIKELLDGFGKDKLVPTPLIRFEGAASLFLDPEELAEREKKEKGAGSQRWLHVAVRGGQDLRLRVEMKTRALLRLKRQFR